MPFTPYRDNEESQGGEQTLTPHLPEMLCGVYPVLDTGLQHDNSVRFYQQSIAYQVN